MTNKLKQFIIQNKELLENHPSRINWEFLYKKLPDDLRGEFTSLMLSKGIQPAYSMISLPNHFAYESNITDFIIPDNVEEIRALAFGYCQNLTTVVVGSGVKRIDSAAFQGCPNLMTVKVSEGNKYYKSIDGNLYTKDGKTLLQYFMGKKDMSFVVPDSVTIIKEFAFLGCENLKNVTIGNNVTDLQGGAFTACHNLTNIVIPGRVEILGNYVFNYCKNLLSVTIEEGVKTIGSGVFKNCYSLKTIVIPNSIISIGGSAFHNCKNNPIINYNGTQREWKNICPRDAFPGTYYTINCTDGTIIKSRRYYE